MLINFLAFQLGWFACVLGAAWGWPWAGTGITVAIVAAHLARAARPQPELALIASAAVIGLLWDSALVQLGWIAYPAGELIEGTAPHWMIALWMVFATTLNVSLSWLKRKLVLAAAFGAVGGPLAYYAGVKLGALVLVDEAAALVALAIGWALLTPLLIMIARRYDGYAPAPAPRLSAGVTHG